MLPEILKALEIPTAQAVIIVSGSAKPFNPRLRNRLIDLLGRGVAQAALECKAILLDEGTKSRGQRDRWTGRSRPGSRNEADGVSPPKGNGSPDEFVSRG